MKFVLGALCLSLAVFQYSFTLLGARNPRRPWWASDTWVSCFHCVSIISLGLAGVLAIGLGILSVESGGPTLVYAAIAAGVLVATGIGVKALNVQRRLAEYEAVALQVLPGAAPSPSRPGDGGHRPQSPPKAA